MRGSPRNPGAAASRRVHRSGIPFAGVDSSPGGPYGAASGGRVPRLPRTIMRFTVTGVTRTSARTDRLEDVLAAADDAMLAVRRARSQAPRDSGGEAAGRWFQQIPTGSVDVLVAASKLGPQIEQRVRRCRDAAEKRRWMHRHARLGEYTGEAVEALLGLVLAHGPRHNVCGELDEWRLEAKLQLVVLLRDYVPKDGNTVEQYIASRAIWVRNDIRETLAEWEEPKSWIRTRAVALSVKDELAEQLGRIPTIDELRERTEVRLREQIVARAGSDRELTDEQIRARLRRDGNLSALRDLGEVLAAGLPHERLDRPVNDDGDTFGDQQSSSDPDGHAAAPGGPTLERLTRVALGDDEWAADALLGRFGILAEIRGGHADPRDSARKGTPISYHDLAAAAGRDSAEVRAVTKRAVARLTSPHAQFAHLAPITFDTERPTLLGGYR